MSTKLKRLKRIAWSGDTAVMLCRVGNPRTVRVMDHSLPADAEFVRAGLDEYGWIWLIICSDEWPIVADGQALDVLSPTVFRYVHADSAESTTHP